MLVVGWLFEALGVAKILGKRESFFGPNFDKLGVAGSNPVPPTGGIA
jgi:hypothetical protein